MPVLLLNRESVAAEIMELARIKIATLLHVPIDIVGARWGHEEGKPPSLAFEVDMNKITGMNADQVRQSMGAVHRWLKGSLAERLEGVKRRRGEC